MATVLVIVTLPLLLAASLTLWALRRRRPHTHETAEQVARRRLAVNVRAVSERMRRSEGH